MVQQPALAFFALPNCEKFSIKPLSEAHRCQSRVQQLQASRYCLEPLSLFENGQGMWPLELGFLLESLSFEFLFAALFEGRFQLINLLSLVDDSLTLMRVLAVLHVEDCVLDLREVSTEEVFYLILNIPAEITQHFIEERPVLQYSGVVVFLDFDSQLFLHE